MLLPREPCTADAVLIFDRLEPANVSFSIRMNHTSVPSGRLLLDYFSPAPDPEYQMYWFFANVQQLVRHRLQGEEPCRGLLLLLSSREAE